MCHHCKGDTWHGMTSVADWEDTVADTWQDDRAVRHLMRGKHVDHSTIDSWQILVGC
jgi:hypothetical protein